MPLKLPQPCAPGSAGVLMPAAALLCSLLLCPLAAAVDLWYDVTLGGSLALTSDAIYRGVSESNGNGAVQADLHVEEGGTFIGAWGSTRDRHLDPYADYDVEAYLGHRFDLRLAKGRLAFVRIGPGDAGMQHGRRGHFFDGRAKQIVRVIVIIIGILSLLKYLAIY